MELTDSIITFVPEIGIAGEGDAQAKVILALFGEILALSQQVAQLAASPRVPDNLAQRVYQLEATLFEQRGSLQSRARGVQEQIQMFMTQGMNPDQILAALQGQAQAADGAVAVAAAVTTQPQTAPTPEPAQEESPPPPPTEDTPAG